MWSRGRLVKFPQIAKVRFPQIWEFGFSLIIVIFRVDGWDKDVEADDESQGGERSWVESKIYRHIYYKWTWRKLLKYSAQSLIFW